ncbi:uncharacterized protein C8Q71DRAFT_74410 [Rhodofomes roseus]|uniref:Uncharacterized protein n=1 Tax=Rhodofomes roseus TaxID=34475 RepID=A0ABQ8KG52_9APHY|nr:uncharacterized protein C8Q71DRAFT_74410 [Rhodofomes roseus]KAH9836266.1 hypothetical protein C8Q71DRAFT_74410 [Rhodofomes roseus]
MWLTNQDALVATIGDLSVTRSTADTTRRRIVASLKFKGGRGWLRSRLPPYYTIHSPWAERSLTTHSVCSNNRGNSRPPEGPSTYPTHVRLRAWYPPYPIADTVSVTPSPRTAGHTWLSVHTLITGNCTRIRKIGSWATLRCDVVSDSSDRDCECLTDKWIWNRAVSDRRGDLQGELCAPVYRCWMGRLLCLCRHGGSRDFNDRTLS